MKTAWAVVAVGLVFIAPAASATTHYLDPTYAIQYYLDHYVNPGDTVILADGTYYLTALSFGGKAMTFQSANGPEYVTFKHGSPGNFDLPILEFNAGESAGTIIRGISFDGNHAYRALAIGYEEDTSHPAASPTFDNCLFEDCRADYGAAVRLGHGAPYFVDCIFSDGWADESGGVLSTLDASLSRPCNPHFNHCVFLDNTGYDGEGGGALHIVDNAQATVEHCLFSGNHAEICGGGIICGYDASLILSYSTFSGNTAPTGTGSGISVDPDGTAEIDHTIIAENGSAPGLRVDSEASAACTHTNIFDNAGAAWQGAISDQYGRDGNISVDPLFCDAANGLYTLYAASQCAPKNNPSGELIGSQDIGCGSTYIVDPDGEEDYTTLGLALANVVAGDAIELVNGVHEGQGGHEGFRIPNIPLAIRSESGEALYCTIDCAGGREPGACKRGFHFGYYAGETGRETLLYGVTISNGSALYGGGIWITGSASPTIRRCTIENCWAIQSVLMEHGSGGGVYCQSSAMPLFDACVIAHNVSEDDGAGVMAMGSSTTVYPTPEFVNCTIANNISINGVGAMCAYSSAQVEITRSIVAFNATKSCVCGTGGADFSIECTDIYGNEYLLGQWDWMGCIYGDENQDGNLHVDPYFCDATHGHYELQKLLSTCDDQECGHMGARPAVKQCVTPPTGLSRQPSIEPITEDQPAFLGIFATEHGLTDLRFRLAEEADVHLSIIDLNGRTIRTFRNGTCGAGNHQLIWDGRDDGNARVAKGIYFYSFRAGEVENRGRCILLH